MASISVRDLDDGVRDRLRVRAAAHGRSMEAEIRAILTEAVDESPKGNLLTTLMERVGEAGGVELELPRRPDSPRRVDFGE
jgi:antitoxin FitA